LESGAADAVICTHWAEGGKGAITLADAVIAATEKPSNFKMLYDLENSIEEKINKIAKEMYGAGQVVLAEKVSVLTYDLYSATDSRCKTGIMINTQYVIQISISH